MSRSLHALPPIETDLNRIATITAGQRDDNEAFRYYVDTMWERDGRSDSALDALVESVAAEVSAQVDCTACGNCCRSLQVGLVPGDVPRLADALLIPPERVLERYVARRDGPPDQEWGVFRHTPCAFLRGRTCVVYAHRPQACRAYPAFTPDFRWLMKPIMAGAGQCPIIFNVIERLKVRLGW